MARRPMTLSVLPRLGAQRTLIPFNVTLNPLPLLYNQSSSLRVTPFRFGGQSCRYFKLGKKGGIICFQYPFWALGIAQVGWVLCLLETRRPRTSTRQELLPAGVGN